LDLIPQAGVEFHRVGCVDPLSIGRGDPPATP
jgi:hypothetical protein